jgi:hypothetical protein
VSVDPVPDQDVAKEFFSLDDRQAREVSRGPNLFGPHSSLIEEALVDRDVPIAGANEKAEHAIYIARTLAWLEPQEAIRSPLAHAPIFHVRVEVDKAGG